MQEVIVYRNPMEAAFWNMARDGAFFPVIVGVVVFFAVFLVLNRVLTRGRNYGQPVWKTYTALGGALVGFGVMFKMASVLWKDAVFSLAMNPIVFVFALTFVLTFFISLIGMTFTKWGAANPIQKTNVAMIGSLCTGLLNVLVHLLLEAWKAMPMTQNTCYMVVVSGGEYEDHYSYTIEVSLDKTVAELRVLELKERHEKVTKLVHELQQRFRTWEQKHRRPQYTDFPRTNLPRSTQKAMKTDATLRAAYDAAVVTNTQAQADYLSAISAWMADWYPDYCAICKRHDVEPLKLGYETHGKLQGQGFDETPEYSVEEAPLIG